MTVDGAGNLAMADTGNNRIRIVAAHRLVLRAAMTAGDIYTVAGNGSASFSGDGGPAISAELNYPCGVAVDGGGDLEVADTSNNRVREVLREAAPTAPGPPTALVATAGNAQVTLNWLAPTSSGTSPITGYDILRSTTSGNESSTPIATGVSGTTYTDVGLTNGTTYFYEVEAVNAVRPSPPSNEASDTPQPSLPAAHGGSRCSYRSGGHLGERPGGPALDGAEQHRRFARLRLRHPAGHDGGGRSVHASRHGCVGHHLCRQRPRQHHVLLRGRGHERGRALASLQRGLGHPLRAHGCSRRPHVSFGVGG